MGPVSDILREFHVRLVRGHRSSEAQATVEAGDLKRMPFLHGIDHKDRVRSPLKQVDVVRVQVQEPLQSSNSHCDITVIHDW